MTMLADRVDFVIGVDTHKQAHTAVTLDRLGALVAEKDAKANVAGYRALLGSCLHLRGQRQESLEWRLTRLALQSTARRFQAAASEAKTLERELDRLTRAELPELRAERGVGPVVAARLSTGWSHAGRFR